MDVRGGGPTKLTRRRELAKGVPRDEPFRRLSVSPSPLHQVNLSVPGALQVPPPIHARSLIRSACLIAIALLTCRLTVVDIAWKSLSCLNN